MGKKLKEFEWNEGPMAVAYIYRKDSDLSYPDLEVEVQIGSDGKTKKIWVSNGCWSGTLFESKLVDGEVDVQVDWYPETVVRGCRIVYLPMGITHNQKRLLAKHFPRMTFEESCRATERYRKEYKRKNRERHGDDDDIPF